MDITTLAAWGEFIGGIAVVVDLPRLADPAELAAATGIHNRFVEPGNGHDDRHVGARSGGGEDLRGRHDES